jgi:hypothetical protein
LDEYDKRALIRFSRKFEIDPNTGCWNWTACTSDKLTYGKFFYKKKNWYAHRFIYNFLIEEVSDELMVCHTCDNPLCVNLDHLFIGTHDDNMRDMAMKGRLPTQIGEANPNNKLTETSVQEMRNLRKAGTNYTSIAKLYDVNIQTAIDAITAKTWRHVV